MSPTIHPSIYQALFDRSPLGECLLSAEEDPIVLAVNDTFLRISGRSRDSLVGRRLFDVFPGDPDDPGDSGLAALRHSLATVIRTGQPDTMPLQRYPIRVTRADGSEVFEERYWHATHIPILDASGALTCIAHRTADVTEPSRLAEVHARSVQRQAFQLELSDRLRPLTSPAEIAAAASAMLGETMRISRVTYVEVNDTAGTFVQRRWNRHGSPEALLEPRQLDDFGPEIIATLRRGEPLIIRDVGADARTRPHAAAYASIGVRSNLAIPLVKAGRLTIVLSLQHDQPRDWSRSDVELAVDVAERTWSAAENARAQEELAIQSRRKDEFLAMLAHELRNPLAAIRVAADLLARGPLEADRQRKTSAIVVRQVGHLSALVDDLLDVSRVTRGIVVLDDTPQDMKAVLASAVEQVRPLMESHQHHLTLDLPPAPATVRGDGKRLVQVVGNLLNNAAKFTPPGGHIQVALSVDGEHVHIRVKDDGMGISNELQARVFELFSQAERSSDRSLGGLGLGLALVRSLVEQHRGTVSVASDGPGTGSCFTVCLPRMHAPAQTVGTPLPMGRASVSRPIDVLIIDDNEDAADVLKTFLEDAGHRVRVEHDPRRALTRSHAAPPEVALIDIGLPTMDGYEVVRRLRADAATTGGQYVALTGYGQASDRRQALAAGFDEHVVKPADPQALLALLDRLVAASPP